ncbi:MULTISPECIES: restriction endonuclease subunit S [unclassified Escherichia]|uniref:restriction endonuclease subunit S n=1 Tax=unclassified Escherichia TaxID=2608889 RepID=UPI0010372ED4|nr:MULTISPECIES: restriction endonuclease subunit S [unclassified Escherichia]TBR69064.1 restriction endonuclease subunit S [Escherichia sp. E10V4]TLI76429.1 restriction endonuclease subunit S [Escherichia sp. E2586]
MTTSLFNRIRPDQIADRLDGEYYAKELLENETKLNHFNQVTLENCVTNIRNAISDLTSNGSFEFLRGIQFNNTNGIPYVRTQNLMDGYIDFSDGIYVDLKCKDMVAKSLCETGDLIVCRKGKVGAASAVSADMHGAAISENVTRFRLDNSYDADFLATFLNSNHGRMRFLREATGVIQKWINNEKLRQIRVIRIDSSAEKYIGDKVRQAEQLRAWAKLLRTSVDAHLNSLNLPINEPPALLNRVSAQTMEDRLDPRPYRTHYLCLVREIEKLPHDSISTLVELASGCPVSSNDFLENSGIPLVRIRNIGFDDFIGLDTGVSQDVYQDATKYQAKDKMIVVGMDGIFRSQFFISDELPMLVNQRVAMLSPQNIRGELLTHWLNRPEGQMQLNQWAVKTTVEHTSLSDIGRVLIPRLDKSLENKLADYLLNARLAYRYAKFLTQVAKTLVEALIEGQLTEQQLIQAQQALEDGDNSLDQAILSKLSAEGYAIEGATPLFSDVDELYSLLEEAAQAEAEE